MYKLIKLEFKRNNLNPYFYGALGIFIFTTLIGTLFSAIPKIEKETLGAQIFSDYNMLVIMITIISMSGFTILSSAMYSKFIINEYTTNKNILLFTYPQKRWKIFLAKFLIVCIFNFVFMTISNVFSVLLIGCIGDLFNINSFLYVDFTNVFFFTFIFSLICNTISIIPLVIGYYKKSNIATIITSVILIIPFANLITVIKNNFIVIVPLIIILMLVSIFLFLVLLKSINEMECLNYENK